MRSHSTRATLLSGAAVGVALIWGTIEFFALLRSRLGDPFHLRGRLRTH
jgi:hypothetical protein